jgi:sulfur-carrier protein adenylyltransferase/sulfurtransferase
MTIDAWWKRLPGRLLEEDGALAALRDTEGLIITYRWIREGNGEARVRATLDLAGEKSLDLEVRFPAHYPEGCPSVRPVPYASLSSHQFGGEGVLCLEFGPDNWHPHYNAADMLRSAWRLVAKEIISTVKPVEIPSRHVRTLAERVRHATGVVLRTPDFEERAKRAAEATDFEYAWSGTYPIRITPTAIPKGQALGDAPPAFRNQTHHTGPVVQLEAATPTVVPSEPDAFVAFVAEHGHRELAADESVVLLRRSEGEMRCYLRLGKEVHRLADVPLETSSASRTADDVRAALSTLKVGIVGLGSLGSKIALTLTRSGVRRWVLVDGDVLLGPNLCRYPSTFASVGSMKVEVIKDALRDITPTEPEITTYTLDVASATNPELHAEILKELASADILIDATANPEVFGVLAMLASDHRRPLVWGEVFGGGLGGLVASAHPEHGPCPRCVRAGFLAAGSEWPPAPGADVADPYGGGPGTPLIATDADVTSIAASVATRSIDLARGETAPPAVSLYGFRRGWIFQSPPEVISVRVRSDDCSCPRCWEVASEPDSALFDRVEALFQPQDDAHDSNPA